MTEADKLGKTGERMVPDIHSGSLMYAEHISRYTAAQKLVKDKVVLDIASGSGYGTQTLAKYAKKVYGVDIDKDSVAYANSKYGGDNIEFKVGDGELIPLPDSSVDIAITFETIEHIKDYKKFVQELKRVVKPDGLVIVSTPNDLEFAEGNHYHLHEFEEKELYGLLKRYFKNIDSYYQATWKYVAIGSRQSVLDKGKVTYEIENYSSTLPKQCLYFYMICSNRDITETIEARGIIAEHYSDRDLIGKDMQHEKNIKDYQESVEHYKSIHQEAVADRDRIHAQLVESLHWIENIKTSKWYKLYDKVSALRSKRSKE
jgi:ubiquinone/menaquinone biosynthesis C-methylase UbiE